MRLNLILLLCAVAAALGQSEDGKHTNQTPGKTFIPIVLHLIILCVKILFVENDLKTSQKQSAKLQNLISSMISFNPTLNAPGKCGEHSRLARDAARNLEVWALKSTFP